MHKLLFISLFIGFFGNTFAQKSYVKNFYNNGNLKEEGWLVNNEKTNYWFFYNEDGSKTSEGHYNQNQKCNWWIFYNEKGKVVKKCEFSNNQLDGFTLIYNKNKLIRAEKYSMNKKTNEWETIAAFKRDNPFLFL